MNESNLKLTILECLKLQSEGMCDDHFPLWTFVPNFPFAQYTFPPFPSLQTLSLKSQLRSHFLNKVVSSPLPSLENGLSAILISIMTPHIGKISVYFLVSYNRL